MSLVLDDMTLYWLCQNNGFCKKERLYSYLCKGSPTFHILLIILQISNHKFYWHWVTKYWNTNIILNHQIYNCWLKWFALDATDGSVYCFITSYLEVAVLHWLHNSRSISMHNFAMLEPPLEPFYLYKRVGVYARLGTTRHQCLTDTVLHTSCNSTTTLSQ